MTERPFVHPKAFANVKTSFAYHDEIASILFTSAAEAKELSL